MKDLILQPATFLLYHHVHSARHTFNDFVCNVLRDIKDCLTNSIRELYNSPWLCYDLERPSS